MADVEEEKNHEDPAPESDLLDDEDDDDLLDDDWEYAQSSDDIADVLIDMLDEKVFSVTRGSGGQQKVIWSRVIAEFHMAYYRKFCERVEGRPQ